MPEAIFQFPRGFLWGCATAAHQVEGGNDNNNWAEWEGTPGRIANGQRSGLACDWWGGRWLEDLERAQERGARHQRGFVLQVAPCLQDRLNAPLVARNHLRVDFTKGDFLQPVGQASLKELAVVGGNFRPEYFKPEGFEVGH